MLKLIINLSASLFEGHKAQHRLDNLCQIAKSFGHPIIYCKQVGGNDSTVFDRQSLAINSNGHIAAHTPAFVESLLYVLVQMTQEDSVLLEGEHAMELAYWEEEVIEALGVGLTDYLGKCSFEQVVLGLSGGIDSAVVAMLATHAGHPCSRHSAGQWHCDALSISSQGAFDDACALAASLNTKPDTLPIEPLIVAYEVALSECFAGLLPNLTKENLQSQIWGILWMAYSNKFGSLLLMTDNKE